MNRLFPDGSHLHAGRGSTPGTARLAAVAVGACLLPIAGCSEKRGAVADVDPTPAPPAQQVATIDPGGGQGPVQPDQRVALFDIAENVADIVRTEGEFADISQTYFTSPEATVHLHVLGKGQICPLHLHRGTHETSVIVAGTADVLEICGKQGAFESVEGPRAPGAAVYSPPMCGHKWINRSDSEIQANLVFAAPPFDGNFYVETGDARMLEGGPSVIWDPDAAIARALSEGLPSLLEPLADARSRMTTLVVVTESALPAATGSMLLYFTRGRGTLAWGTELPVRDRQLVMLPPAVPIRVRAEEGAPLAVLVFRPQDALP